MAWKWRDIPRLLTSPNRSVAISRVWYAWAWLPLFPLAWLYRRTLARGTKVVVVVGSTGKTTTTTAVREVLGGHHSGAINANFGFHLIRNLVRAAPGKGPVVMEVGISRPGQMARYASMLRPDVAVVTTVGSDHHPALGGMSGVFKEKAAMVECLSANGLAVLNGDDPRVREMAGLTKAEVLFHGLGGDNQVRAEDVLPDWPRGSSFTLVAPEVRFPVSLPLLGEHLIRAALAAAAVGLYFGAGKDAIKEGLARLAPVNGRMHPLSLGDNIWLVEDYYKNTRETIEAALDFLAQSPAQRKIVVLGAVETPEGSTNAANRELGAAAGAVADKLLYLGGKFKPLAAGAKNSGMAREDIIDCHNSVAAAHRQLKSMLAPGDLVLLKGRGSQQFKRITLMLHGRKVSCALQLCEWPQVDCEQCALLNTGKNGSPPKSSNQ